LEQCQSHLKASEQFDFGLTYGFGDIEDVWNMNHKWFIEEPMVLIAIHGRRMFDKGRRKDSTKHLQLHVLLETTSFSVKEISEPNT
jgi:hypothetical protein